MMTLEDAQARVDAAEYDHDIALYDRGRGLISQEEFDRASIVLEDARLDLANVEARIGQTSYVAVLPVDPLAHPMSGRVGEY